MYLAQKKCLSDARIQEELSRLRSMQQIKEAELASLTAHARASLQQLHTESLATLTLADKEARAAIDAIRALREDLRATHPAPNTLPPLSPRKTFPAINADKN